MEDRNGGVSVWGWEVADSRLKPRCVVFLLSNIWKSYYKKDTKQSHCKVFSCTFLMNRILAVRISSSKKPFNVLNHERHV